MNLFSSLLAARGEPHTLLVDAGDNPIPLLSDATPVLIVAAIVFYMTFDRACRAHQRTRSSLLPVVVGIAVALFAGIAPLGPLRSTAILLVLAAVVFVIDRVMRRLRDRTR